MFARCWVACITSTSGWPLDLYRYGWSFAAPHVGSNPTGPPTSRPHARSLVQMASRAGKIRKTKGALFVAIVKLACADGGISMKHTAQPALAGAGPITSELRQG